MIYFFDGSKDGFLTAFLQAFPDKNAILTSKKTQLVLGDAPRFIQTNAPLAEKAKLRLQTFDKHCLEDLDLLLRCGEEDHEQTAFEYFRFLAQTKYPVRDRLSVPEVFKAVAYIKKVRYEIHRFHGFIRFIESESGALYAPFSPDNDICDLLIPHFRARLPQFCFVIHDVKRKKAAVYDGENTFVAPLEQADILLSANEERRQTLWKRYYSAVNIPSRERLRQMRGYMPERYWKFLPEKQ